LFVNKKEKEGTCTSRFHIQAQSARYTGMRVNDNDQLGKAFIALAQTPIWGDFSNILSLW